jgi:hypothetical protein
MSAKSLPLFSGKKIEYWNSNESRGKAQAKVLTRMPHEEKGRIALKKDKAGEKSVPRHEQQEQETYRGANRYPQRHSAVSIVPAIRSANH